MVPRHLKVTETLQQVAPVTFLAISILKLVVIALAVDAVALLVVAVKLLNIPENHVYAKAAKATTIINIKIIAIIELTPFIIINN